MNRVLPFERVKLSHLPTTALYQCDNPANGFPQSNSFGQKIMNRRNFSRHLLGLAALSGTVLSSDDASACEQHAGIKPTQRPNSTSRAGDPVAAQVDSAHSMPVDDGPRLQIVMLAYPGMFPLDFAGPLSVFESLMNRDIHIVWKSLDPIGSEDPKIKASMVVQPTTRFEDCPSSPDVLFVPGGIPGTFTQMQNPETLEFLARIGASSRYVTSVCTGSLILGAAGLLNGYKAASHWLTTPVLNEFGAIPTAERIVKDRNRITAGGVTAGIDFGLYLASQLRTQAYAEAIQLYLEYDPSPPFNAGSPKTAKVETTAFLAAMFAPVVEQATGIARNSPGSVRKRVK
jgi:cyclohexyl-isocyanide hydratase